MKIRSILLLAVILLFACKEEEQAPPNVLIIIADDVNYDSFGYTGEGVAPDVTPIRDRLASQSISFTNAFSTVAVCQPSRQSMLTGLIPHHYGSKGFFPIKSGTPTLPALLRESGYVTGTIHKKHHMLPLEDFNWTFDQEALGLTAPDGVVGRDPQMLAQGLQNAIERADEEGKPFFMVVSSADAHRPFHGDPPNKNIPFWGNGEVEISYPDPSRIYTANEVNLTPALPDIPAIREDLAKYASSVRRLDDSVGECLKVLDEMDKSDNTIVIFVADNGMPLAFAKFDTYFGSNHSPLLIRWPRHIEKAAEYDHLVSLVDITPTILELTGLKISSPMDGRSLVPFINNQSPEEWRQSIVFIRNEDIYYGDGLNTVLNRDPEFTKRLEETGWKPSDHEVEGTYVRKKEIRTFFDGRFGYIYNNCYRHDGLEAGPIGTIVPYNGVTIRAMKEAGKDDPEIRKRLENYLLRAPEEFYDWSKDPGSHRNLAYDPEYKQHLGNARLGLLEYMRKAEDPLINDFQRLIEQM
jgi:N-sulfoglucosamine sulfohydrolase